MDLRVDWDFRLGMNRLMNLEFVNKMIKVDGLAKNEISTALFL